VGSKKRQNSGLQGGFCDKCAIPLSEFDKYATAAMKILIVEDDPNIAELIAIHLRDLPAQVTTVHQGWQGLDEAATGKYDFLVLDLMLPGVNGMEICRQLRARKQHIPILMLTAKSEEQDKIAGLEQGADDYLTKPFSPGELMARVKTILRRTRGETKTLEKQLLRIERGALVMDLERKSVQKGTQTIDLTAKEFELLQLFMQNPGRNFTRQQILDEVWGEQFEGLEHTVNSHINRLRAKIEDNAASPNFILTAWGTGYKFAE
jgi:two-component system, OmpR family, alkaline phosphatase synthesis response regulator PhoP